MHRIGTIAKGKKESQQHFVKRLLNLALKSSCLCIIDTRRQKPKRFIADASSRGLNICSIPQLAPREQAEDDFQAYLQYLYNDDDGAGKIFKHLVQKILTDIHSRSLSDILIIGTGQPFHPDGSPASYRVVLGDEIVKLLGSDFHTIHLLADYTRKEKI